MLEEVALTLFVPDSREEEGGQKTTQTGTQTVDKVYHLIKENPYITRDQLAKALGKSTKTIRKGIETLKNEKRIKRIGSATFGGHWEVIE